jgi:RNA polymerase sigma factor (sigma-70 family)
MSVREDSKTSPTLLEHVALTPPDQEAWTRFVARYGSKIVRWCRARGLEQAEIEDVSQAVLTELVVRLRRFTYDPARSFRGFLHKVVNDAVLDAFAARGRKSARGGSEVLELLASAEARKDLARRLEEEYDLEVLEEATRRVRRRVLPHTWEAYRLTAEEGLSGAETAIRLSMQVAAVYVAKGSVLRMLQEEIRVLGSDDSSSGRQ